MIKSLTRIALFSSLAMSMGMQAQEHIPLTNDEIQQFGIVFSPVEVMDGETGMRIPATIINSPMAISDITARYEGVLESWQVLPGEKVTANQVLGVINSQEVLGIQQEWIMADSSLKEAQFNLDKDDMLFADGVISEQRLVQTRRAFQEARVNAQAARQKLQLAGFTDAQMNALLSDSDGLGKYYIRTPAAGTISHLAYNAGSYVPDNAELVSFSSGNLWVRAQLPARLAAGLESGQQVRLAELPNTLVLRLQDFAADESSQMIDVYAEFNQPINRLPGQVVTLMLTPAGGGILVPADAVVHSGDDTHVFVRVNDGVEARSLSLVPVGSDYLAQTGLSAGDRVVTRGAAQIKGIQLGLGGE